MRSGRRILRQQARNHDQQDDNHQYQRRPENDTFRAGKLTIFISRTGLFGRL